MLVHSPLYSCPALNFWANKWFDEELDKLKKDPQYAHLDISRIHPATIVEIDTIILYEEQFKDGTFDFFNLVDAYHEEVDLRKVHASLTGANAHALRQLPFAEWVRQMAHRFSIDPNLTRIDDILTRFGIS